MAARQLRAGDFVVRPQQTSDCGTDRADHVVYVVERLGSHRTELFPGDEHGALAYACRRANEVGCHAYHRTADGLVPIDGRGVRDPAWFTDPRD